jgi:glutamate 5-kinase
MRPQRPAHRVVALDESLFVDQSRVVDRNALVDIALGVRRSMSDAHQGTVLMLDRCVTVGRTRQGPLRSAGRERRPLIYQAIGIVPILQGLLRELDSLGVHCGLVNVSRESFADRRQYFAIRDVVRGLLRNGVIPLVFDIGETMSVANTPHADYLQIAAMLSGMLGAASLDIRVGDQVPIVFTGPNGPIRSSLIDEFDALWRNAEVKTTGKGRDLIEPLLAAARLVAYSGATITVQRGRPVGDQLDIALTLSSPVDRRAMTGVQRWLVAGAVPEGAVVASEYAASRLTQINRGSLLAAGVVRCEGKFEKDTVVSVVDEDGRLLGYGVSRYGTADIERVRGTPDVVVVHADHFFGVGLGALATSPPTAAA